MDYELLRILTFLSPFILAVGIGIGIYRYKTLEPIHRMLFYYLILCIVFDIMTRLPFLVWTTNLVFLVLFSLFELVFFYLLYLGVYSNKKNPILLIAVPLGIAYIVSELFYINFREPENFQSYAKVVDTICIMLMAIGYFFDRFRKPVSELWFFFQENSVILVCFSFYIVFFIPINFLIKGNTNGHLYLWLLHLFVTVGFYFYILVELWKNGRIRKQSPFG
ncbi:hypothetical protein D3C87_38960 [compost metagenome]